MAYQDFCSLKDRPVHGEVKEVVGALKATFTDLLERQALKNKRDRAAQERLQPVPASRNFA